MGIHHIRLVSSDRLVFRDREYPCVTGKGGIRKHKIEGDGATPTGRHPLRHLLYRTDRVTVPATMLARKPIRHFDGWCDDIEDPAYNCPVRLPHPARHEELWREDHVYDLCVVLGYNDNPVLRRKGSAIFMHLMREDRAPTEGCVALTPGDMVRILEAVEPGCALIVPELLAVDY